MSTSDVADVGERDRGAQAGDAAADDEEIGGHAHGAILSISHGLARSRDAVLPLTVHQHADSATERCDDRSTSRTANQQSTILVGEGLGDQLAPLLDRHGVGAAALRRLEPGRSGAIHGRSAFRRPSAASRSCIPDGERYKNAAVGRRASTTR